MMIVARRMNASSWRPLYLVCASTTIAVSMNVAADTRHESAA
jgi:hypothetical protein